MRHELYSELRTVYEATSQNPRTFRITIKLKDMVDETVLQDAVRKTMERYPYFRVRLGMDEKDVFFEDNPTPTPVLHTDGPIMLGGYETQSHLLAFCWWKNKVHIDVWHALTDGGGMYHLLQTFLYHYCSKYYGRELSTTGIWFAGDEVRQEEWDDPARKPLSLDPSLLVNKWHDRAFQIGEGGIARVGKRCIVYNIRIPEDEFMRFNLSKEGSPGTVVALFLSRAIASLHPHTADPVAIALCVNQRRALGAPLAHQSLVGDARLVFRERMKAMSFAAQETCFRGMVAIQTDIDMVRREVQEYQELVEVLKSLPTHEARHAHCKQLAHKKSLMFTATVSYVGKAPLGDAEFYVQEFHALPSTALPSCKTPITLELSAVNGSFYVNFMQFFEEDDYLRAFIGQLRENDINYDVLYQEQTKYPGFVCPWTEE
ncbi:MAG: hypothetical protein Q4A01_07545 [Coriobacteriales bacterium]|nr:hypothetical protein [Coriobacteriales bacterium]